MKIQLIFSLRFWMNKGGAFFRYTVFIGRILAPLRVGVVGVAARAIWHGYVLYIECCSSLLMSRTESVAVYKLFVSDET